MSIFRACETRFAGFNLRERGLKLILKIWKNYTKFMAWQVYRKHLGSITFPKKWNYEAPYYGYISLNYPPCLKSRYKPNILHNLRILISIVLQHGWFLCNLLLLKICYEYDLGECWSGSCITLQDSKCI